MFTTKEAIDRAVHILTRQRGLRLLFASEAAKRDQRMVQLSGVRVIPDSNEAEKLGALAQLLYDVDPSASEQARDWIFAASEREGKRVKTSVPVQNPATGVWWHKGEVVDAPKKEAK